MTTSATLLLALAASALLSGAAFADPGVKLYCAREVTGFADAEMHLRERGPHTVEVTFADVLPSQHPLDWALRDCLSTAVKLDGLQDIVVLAWYRTRLGILEPIEPYAGQAQLVYQASRKAVMLKKGLSVRRPVP